jgi:hypothetical protein
MGSSRSKMITALGTLALLGVAPLVSMGAEAHGSEHAVHKHHVAIFLGDTTTSGGQHGATVGADYGYRIHDLISLAAAVDYAAGEIDATILAAGIFLHPLESLRVLLAPGVDVHGNHQEFVFRAGLMVDFHIGNFTLSPTAYIDLLEAKEDTIYGLSFGYGF